MVRIKTGHYSDVFRGEAFEVRRCRYPIGSRTLRGWEYAIKSTGYCSVVYPTKGTAITHAKARISAYQDAV